jgi:hypothetical protein
MGTFVVYRKTFIEILKHYKFDVLRQHKTSHQRWCGIVDGKTRFVDVDLNNDPYTRELLKYMIAQSGIPKKVFRNWR